MRRFRYVVCDVFTDVPLDREPARRLHGRPRPRHADDAGDGPRDELRESVFVLPPTAEDADVRIRIFTPARELPFAGHPTLGTRVRARRPAVEDRDPPRDRLGRRSGRSGAGGAAHRLRPDGAADSHLGAGRRTRGRVFAALGVERSGLPVERYDLGPGHVYVELESPEAGGRTRAGLLARSRA